MFVRIAALLAAGVIVTACAKILDDKRKEQPLINLEGSEWGMDQGEQFVAFKANGDVNGFGGCNNFFGQYSQDGTRLTLGPLASTKKMCPDMQSETRFMQSLQDTRYIKATHLRLTLMDEDQNVLMNLRRRDWD